MGVIKRFTEVRFVLRNGTFCSETPEHFVLRIIVGVDGLNAYLQGTKTLLTAKAALTIAKAFAKRSLGIVGTAWAIYDYYDCMNS